MARQKPIFTIYDMMDAKGVFDENTANRSSAEYEFQEYPKMLYHPEGQKRITVPAEIVVTPLGAKEVGEQKELIWRLARDEKEEAKLVDEGWHLTPAASLAEAARIKPEPVDLAAENVRLRQELAKANQAIAAKPEASPKKGA